MGIKQGLHIHSMSPASHGSAPSRKRDGAAQRQRRSLKHRLAQIRREIDNISQEQEDLSEARRDLSIERDGWLAKMSQVRNQRIRTGNAEAKLMTTIQRAFPDGIPPEIAEDWQAVQTERDKLGPLDDDLVQQGEALGGAEWDFMDKEVAFYQRSILDVLSEEALDSDHSSTESETDNFPQIIQSPGREIMPSEGVQYQVAVADLRRLVKQFNVVRQRRRQLYETKEQSDGIELAFQSASPHPEFDVESSRLLGQITKIQVHIQKLQQGMKPQSEHIGPRMARRKSDPNPVNTRILPIDTVSKAPTEGSVPPKLEFPPVEQRVQEWLLDVLRNNAVEKQFYLQTLNAEMKGAGLDQINQDSWEDRAIQYWQFDSHDQGIPGSQVSFPTATVSGSAQRSFPFRSPSSSASFPGHDSTAVDDQLMLKDMRISEEGRNLPHIITSYENDVLGFLPLPATSPSRELSPKSTKPLDIPLVTVKPAVDSLHDSSTEGHAHSPKDPDVIRDLSPNDVRSVRPSSPSQSPYRKEHNESSKDLASLGSETPAHTPTSPQRTASIGSTSISASLRSDSATTWSRNASISAACKSISTSDTSRLQVSTRSRSNSSSPVRPSAPLPSEDPRAYFTKQMSATHKRHRSTTDLRHVKVMADSTPHDTQVALEGLTPDVHFPSRYTMSNYTMPTGHYPPLQSFTNAC